MNYRESLEFAASAAGLDVLWDNDLDSYIFSYSLMRRICWNPLTSNNDALELAVTLGISLHLSNEKIYAEAVAYDLPMIEEPRGGNPLSATRRAIVRAAAEIGKGIK